MKKSIIQTDDCEGKPCDQNSLSNILEKRLQHEANTFNFYSMYLDTSLTHRHTLDTLSLLKLESLLSLLWMTLLFAIFGCFGAALTVDRRKSRRQATQRDDAATLVLVMSSAAVKNSFKQEKKGSFFKLIESFAFELGTLKKELGHTSESKAADLGSEPLESVDEDVGGLFLRGSPCSGLCSGENSPLRAGLSGLSGLRDSGYSGSLHRKLTVLERLIRTHSVWLQLGLNQQGALKILKNQPPGRLLLIPVQIAGGSPHSAVVPKVVIRTTFVVRRSSSQQRKVLCVRMDSDSDPVQDFAVKESQYAFSLEGSGLSFADLFRLVAFCCISRFNALKHSLTESFNTSSTWHSDLVYIRGAQTPGLGEVMPLTPALTQIFVFNREQCNDKL
ncbi:hypothetical protein WMY93_033779 [Mugilogobius chulae]|uniref:Uncharacterized protein n=1 Tax=Mugilogobius chulae TaxID=88201 RepID=A0AAW0MK36_9GOBI